MLPAAAARQPRLARANIAGVGRANVDLPMGIGAHAFGPPDILRPMPALLVNLR
jgi:hypothetical protein